MKVICISNTAESHKDAKGLFRPIEGNIYTVIETVHWYDYDWYLLKEDGGGNGWNPRYFIPLSDINEKIISYEKETV